MGVPDRHNAYLARIDLIRGKRTDHHRHVKAAKKSATETRRCCLSSLDFARIAKRGSTIAGGLQHALRHGLKDQLKLVKVPTLPLPENQ